MRELSHGAESAASADGAGVAAGEQEGTCTGELRLSDIQRDCREQVKRFAHDVSADTCGKPALGRALGKSGSYGKKLADPEDPLPLALGDVMAIGKTEPEFAEELLEKCLRELRAQQAGQALSLESLERHLVARLGPVALSVDKACRDGKVKPPEAREIQSTLRPARRLIDQMYAITDAIIAPPEAQS
jgi:hypothetical protein